MPALKPFNKTLGPYGVWKGVITGWNPTTTQENIHSTFEDDNLQNLEAAVHIEGSDMDKRLVYWGKLFDPLGNHKPPEWFLELEKLPMGFHPQANVPRATGSLALDYFRDPLFELNDDHVLSHWKTETEPTIDELIAHKLDLSVSEGHEVYLFGNKYNDPQPGAKQGIHTLHMNQGGSQKFRSTNGTYQDGGILLQTHDASWIGIFLAFAFQADRTDEKGHPLGDHTLGEKLGQWWGEDADDGSNAVAIHGALINPFGPDQNPTHGDPETVYLINEGEHTVLEGELAPEELKRIRVPRVPLPNNGGTIALKDYRGAVIDKVTYSRSIAKFEGIIVPFRKKCERTCKHHENLPAS